MKCKSMINAGAKRSALKVGSTRKGEEATPKMPDLAPILELFRGFH